MIVSAGAPLISGTFSFRPRPMKNYFKEVIDPWLDTLLASMPEAERKEAKRQIKSRLLESYRNGFEKLMDKFDNLSERLEEIKRPNK